MEGGNSKPKEGEIQNPVPIGDGLRVLVILRRSLLNGGRAACRCNEKPQPWYHSCSVDCYCCTALQILLIVHVQQYLVYCSIRIIVLLCR